MAAVSDTEVERFFGRLADLDRTLEPGALPPGAEEKLSRAR